LVLPIPKVLNHSALGWPIQRGLPRVYSFIFHNPESGCINPFF
jgi:hypothetical protein